MKFYVYRIFVDGVVRYIGKGSGNRAWSHMQKVRSILRRRALGETVIANYFYNRLAKAFREGRDIQIEIMRGPLSEADAFDVEMKTIASASGLWNITPGGENPPRVKFRTPEQIAKIKASNVITWSDPQLRQDHSEKMKALWFKPGYREAVSKPRGKSQKASDAAKKRWSNPAYRSKMKRTHDDPAFTRRRSKATKRGWETRRAKQ